MTHDSQKVHSNEQMRASFDSGGRSILQHSQDGRSFSMSLAPGYSYGASLANVLTRAPNVK
jgi:hypothetical protein